MQPYILTTPRLGLRLWQQTDIHPFAAMNMDADVMRFFPNPLTLEASIAMMNRITLHFENNNFGLFVVEEKSTNNFMGFTGFSIPTFNNFFTPCVEIGWRFKKEYWGQGFATEAAKSCLQYGFNQLKFDKIVSFTAAVNKPSEKVMQRIGMKYVTDFEHPAIEKESMLCTHVLYEITKPDESHI